MSFVALVRVGGREPSSCREKKREASTWGNFLFSGVKKKEGDLSISVSSALGGGSENPGEDQKKQCRAGHQYKQVGKISRIRAS